MALDPIRYFLSVAGRTIEVRDVAGRETIFAPFRFELTFHDDAAATGDLPLDPDEILKTEVVLELSRASLGDARQISGIITDASVGAVIRGAPLVRLVVEPRLALLKLRKDIRHFRDKAAPAIVSEVLSGLGVPHELRLTGSYEVRPYCVQMRETDFDFISRLLEDEGIYYYFLPGGTMVLGDSAGAYDSISGDPALPFRAASAMDREEEAVHELDERSAFTAGKIALRDFNPDHPSLDMDVSAAAPTEGGPEFYDFPGEYLEPGYGARKATIWAESLEHAASHVSGRSSSGRLCPGHTLRIADTPGGELDGSYVVTSVVHAFHRTDEGFSVEFEAIPAERAYRPPRLTPAPVLLNPVTAYVTGPPGEDVHPDSMGRVKIHFHWDRIYPKDDTCSHWVPVLQDNTGHSIGIPRIGWEVLAHFMEGDPDRPVVLGRVYNAEDKFPVPLPERKTCSSLKSLCSPGRDGTNEIQLDDIAGAEYILVHAEKDQNIVVANDKSEHVMVSESIVTRRDESVTVGANSALSVGGSISGTIDQDQTLSVGGSRDVTIGDVDNSTVEGNRTLTIGGMHFRRTGLNDVVTADVLNETVGGVIMETSLKSNTTEAGRSMTVTVGGAIVEISKDSKNESATKGRVETVGGLLFTKAGDEFKVRADKKRVTTVGGAMKVTAAKEIVLTGAEKISMSATLSRVTAKTGALTLKVGESQVRLSGDTIEIVGKSEIKLNVTGTNDQGASISTQV